LDPMEGFPAELLCVLGPTAVGKTAFAARLANRIGGEIISADSRQVYRGMDIGTGKDYDDYLVEGSRIPFHLVDILDAGDEYNVYLFKQDFLRAFQDITERDKIPVLCGGSGLYIESVLKNFKLIHVPVNEDLRAELEQKSSAELEALLKSYGPLHNQTDTVNRKRLIRAIEIAMFQASRPGDIPEGGDLESVVLGIRLERSERRKRITERLHRRLDQGLVAEVEDLIRHGVTPDRMEYYGLEYRYVSRYLMKVLGYDEMVEQLNTAIHRFAKRQMTYFRGMERRGIRIHWIDGMLSPDEQISRALEICNGERE
jgi:tRNA dimethylallyltransferase